jgi:hypothetical protein
MNKNYFRGVPAAQVYKAGNKYGAKKSLYAGVVYDSKKEMEYAMFLDSHLRAKRIKKWERQIPFDLVVNKVKICRYIVDFKITHTDKTVEYVDVKGYKKGPAYTMFRVKQKLMKACHDIDVIVV